MTLKQEALISMINEYLAKTDVLVSTQKFLLKLKETILVEGLGEAEEATSDPFETLDALTNVDRIPEDKPKIEISCDASIKKNPGGPSAVGAIIRVPGQKENIQVGLITKSTTNNQAEYDAIYTGITTLLNIFNRPQHQVVIYSDSQLVVNQLRKVSKCNDTKLANKRDMILELVDQSGIDIKFEWRARNSTEDLKNANYIAQDLLGVKRH